MTESRRVEQLRRDHSVDDFDWGNEELNRYLLRYALQNQQAGAAQTYLNFAEEVIVGYYTLAIGDVILEGAPDRLKKGLAKHPIPIMLLARLAVAPLAWSRRQGTVTRRDAAYLAGG